MNAIERLRAGIGTGDRLVPGTMSQEEADALDALAAVDALYRAANDFLRMNSAERYQSLAAAVRRVEGE